MDPISVIGAASSVVGIAGFGIQLSQVLCSFISQARSASITLRTLIDGVNATTGVMDQVRGLLEDEKRNIENGHIAMLFNTKALDDVKGRADQCLILFWRIENVIVKKREARDFEEKLAERLEAFNADIKAKREPQLAKLDTHRIFSKLECLKWAYVAPKLDQYSKELDRIQLNLVLMFQVISMRARSIKPKLTTDDMQFIWEIASRIRRLAGILDLPSSFDHPRISRDHYGYEEQYTSSSRRLESPWGHRRGSENNLYPFMRGELSNRGSSSPRRLVPSSRNRGLSLSPHRVPVYPRRGNQNSSPSTIKSHPQIAKQQPGFDQQSKSEVEHRLEDPVAQNGNAHHISPLHNATSDVIRENNSVAKEHDTAESKTHQPESPTPQSQARETQDLLNNRAVPRMVVNAEERFNHAVEQEKVVGGNVSLEAISKPDLQFNPDVRSFYSSPFKQKKTNITSDFSQNGPMRTTFRESTADRVEDEGVVVENSFAEDIPPKCEEMPKDKSSGGIDGPKSNISDSGYEYEEPSIDPSPPHNGTDSEIGKMLPSEESVSSDLTASVDYRKDVPPGIVGINEPSFTPKETLAQFSYEARASTEKALSTSQNSVVHTTTCSDPDLISQIRQEQEQSREYESQPVLQLSTTSLPTRDKLLSNKYISDPLTPPATASSVLEDMSTRNESYPPNELEPLMINGAARAPNQESRSVIFEDPNLPKIFVMEPHTPRNDPPNNAVQSSAGINNIQELLGREDLERGMLVNEDNGASETCQRSGESAVDECQKSRPSLSIVNGLQVPSERNDSLSSEVGRKVALKRHFLRRIKSMFQKRFMTEFDEEGASMGLEIAAYVIRRGEFHRIPHSGKLGLKKVHLKKLIMQPQGEDWFKTFAFLESEEMTALENIINSDSDLMLAGSLRKLILLKRMKEAGLKFWKRRDKSLLAIVGCQWPSSHKDGYNDNTSVSRRSKSSARSYSLVDHGEYVPQELDKPNQQEPLGFTLPVSQTQTRNTFPANSQILPTGSPLPPSPPPPPPPQHQRVSSQPSWMIRDITPQKVLSEVDCRERLTTYYIYTLVRSEPNSVPLDIGWERCEVIREHLEPQEVAMRVCELNRNGQSVVEKKLELFPGQQKQITVLIDDLRKTEMDQRFEWTLAQLESPDTRTRTEEQHSKSIFSSRDKNLPPVTTRQPKPLVVYLRRAPAYDLNCVLMYQSTEKNKADRFRPPNPPPPPQPPPPQFSGPIHGRSNSTTQSSSTKFVKISKPAPKGTAKSKSKSHRRSRHHHSSTDSDSDTDESDTNYSSWSKDGADRNHGASRKYNDHSSYLNSSRSDRKTDDSLRYPGPNVSQSSLTRDAITSAYRSGKEDARAELQRQEAALRSYTAPPPPPRSGTDQDVLRKAERRLDAKAVDYLDQRYRDGDRSNWRRAPSPEFFDRSLVEQRLNRKGFASAPSYPEYYDKLPYNIRDEPLKSSVVGNDDTDIVSKLLLEWTPAESGEREGEDENSEELEECPDMEISLGAGSKHQVNMGSNTEHEDISLAENPKPQHQGQRTKIVDSPQALPVDLGQNASLPGKDYTITGENIEMPETRTGTANPQLQDGRESEVGKRYEERPFQPPQSTATTSITQPAWLDRGYERQLIEQMRKSGSPPQKEGTPVPRMGSVRFREPRSNRFEESQSSEPASSRYNDRIIDRRPSDRYIDSASESYPQSEPPPVIIERIIERPVERLGRRPQVEQERIPDQTVRPVIPMYPVSTASGPGSEYDDANLLRRRFDRGDQYSDSLPRGRPMVPIPNSRHPFAQVTRRYHPLDDEYSDGW